MQKTTKSRERKESKKHERRQWKEMDKGQNKKRAHLATHCRNTTKELRKWIHRETATGKFFEEAKYPCMSRFVTMKCLPKKDKINLPCDAQTKQKRENKLKELRKRRLELELTIRKVTRRSRREICETFDEENRGKQSEQLSPFFANNRINVTSDTCKEIEYDE